MDDDGDDQRKRRQSTRVWTGATRRESRSSSDLDEGGCSSRSSRRTTSAPATAAARTSSRSFRRSGSSEDGAAAKPAIDVVKNGEIRFVPDRMKTRSTTTGWRTSRTGASRASSGGATRFPAWYCDDCGETIVSEDGAEDLPEVRRHAPEAGRGRARHLVLLGAVAVLDARLAGEDAEELDYFYPTDVLVTGYDIIFFWVAA
jgi:hypothetical protein